MRKQVFLPGDFHSSIYSNLLLWLIALLVFILTGELIPLLITTVWLVYIAYLLLWLEVTDEHLVFRGLFRAIRMEWPSIKTVRNDYPRIILSQWSVEDEARQKSLVSRGQDMDPSFKDKIISGFVVKGMKSWTSLLALLKERAINAEIDEGISRWKV
ncbi:MAG: hypothetical protein AAB669_00025 [Patescibacteria group bacterium]